MNSKYFAVAVVLLFAIAASTTADDDDYHYMPQCDSRCDISNRLTPFAHSCDDCCRAQGFRKGKCKGFGWQYCKCKPNGIIRSVLQSILNK